MFTNPVARKVLGTVLAIVIATVGVVGIIAFFEARDSSTTGGTETAKPKQVNTGSVLKDGNVVLTYSDPSYKVPLHDFSESNGGDTDVLRAAGGAVIIKRDPQAAGVVAKAFAATQQYKSPEDPGLQDFVDEYLGQGDSG
jgi:hypothetical protein